MNRIYNAILIYQKSCWMCISIDIVLHHATIKRYFDSFLTRRETLGYVGQKCVRPPQFFFDRYAYGVILCWILTVTPLSPSECKD